MRYEIAPIGQGFLWMGLYSMLFFTGVYIRSIFRVQQKSYSNYAYRILLTSIAVITFLCHCFAASVLLIDTETSNSMDPHNYEYIKWLLTTQIFIILICLLQKSKPLHTFSLITADIVMIGTGYAAYLTPIDTQFWQYFIFSGCMWIFIVIQLLRSTYTFYYDGLTIQMMFVNRAIFSALVGLIIVSWSVYPTIILLKRNEIIDLTTEFSLYMVFDCLNKGIYGLLFLGAKEVEEKMDTQLANYTRTIAAIVPVHSAYRPVNQPPREIQDSEPLEKETPEPDLESGLYTQDSVLTVRTNTDGTFSLDVQSQKIES